MKSLQTQPYRPPQVSEAGIGDAASKQQDNTQSTKADSIDAEREQPSSGQSLNEVFTDETWNPADITDQSIEQILKPAVLKRARTMLEQGQLVQLVKAKKPLATFLTLGTSIRFLVKNDIRYTFCNCKEEQPCVHAALAVWSFRKLPSNSGMIFTGPKAEQVNPSIIHSVEAEMINLIKVGMSGMSPMAIANIREAMTKCTKSKLHSSAEILEEVMDDWQKYQEVDSLFNEEVLLERVSELVIRHDFLLSGSAALPFLIVRGLASERSNLLDSTRLIGLGCGLAQKKKQTIISAYFQDESTGTLCAAVQRNSDKANDEEQHTYSALASRLQYKSQSIAELGKSAILAKSLKLSTSREINFGRNPFLSGAQKFDWSQLKSPIFAENFSELRQLASLTAPPYLGLRAIGSKIHAVAIAGADFPTFSILEQAVTAQLVDHSGNVATLYHPYTSRGAAGVEQTLRELLNQDQRCIYIAGEVAIRASGLQISPTGIVFEDRAGKRHICQPWVDKLSTSGSSVSDEGAETLNQRTSELIDLVRELGDFLSSMLLIGLNNSHEDIRKKLEMLIYRSSRMGSTLLNKHMESLQSELQLKLHNSQWQSTAAAEHFMKLCVFWRIAQDELASLG